MIKKWVLSAFMMMVVPLMAAQAQASNGAIAVDRNNGFIYGVSYNYSNMNQAINRAMRECRSRGGRCSVVLQIRGRQCGAYATIDSRNGTAYGWGTARSQSAALNRARQECRARARGHACRNYAYACNSR